MIDTAYMQLSLSVVSAGGDGGGIARAGVASGASGRSPCRLTTRSALPHKTRQARGAVPAERTEPSTETATGDGPRGLAVEPEVDEVDVAAK